MMKRRTICPSLNLTNSGKTNKPVNAFDPLVKPPQNHANIEERQISNSSYIMIQDAVYFVERLS